MINVSEDVNLKWGLNIIAMMLIFFHGLFPLMASWPRSESSLVT
jgi:hypothetical protein